MLKKGPLVFIAFNFLFTVGVTILVARSLSTPLGPSPLESWFIKAVQNTAADLHNDWPQKHQQAQALLHTGDLRKKQAYAQQSGLAFAMEAQGDDLRDLLGNKATDKGRFPYQQRFFSSEMMGVHRHNDSLYFTYFLNEGPPPLALSEKKNIKELKDRLEILGISFSVIEQVSTENETSLIIYSSLEPEIARSLEKQISLAKRSVDATSGIASIPESLQTMTLNNELYLLSVVNLGTQNFFVQKAVYAFKIPNYQIVSMTDMFLLIWGAFILCTLINIILWKKWNTSSL